MNKEAQAVVVTLMGGLLVSITVTGRYTSYVKPGFGPLLIIAGMILMLVGVASLFSAIRSAVRRDRAEFDNAQFAVDSTAEFESEQFAVDSTAEFDNAQFAVDSTAEFESERAVGSYRSHGEASAHDHADDAADDPGHNHDRSKVPWLILLPAMVLLVMAPPALGADAVSRDAGSQALAGMAGVKPASGVGASEGAGGTVGGYAFNDGSGHAEGTKAFAAQRPTMQFPALPTGADPVITLKEFVMRALYDGQDSVSDTPVTVTGFVAGAGDGYSSGYSIARLVISCCAADASPMRLHVAATEKLPVNTWVTAVVTAEAGTASEANDYVPTVDVTSMKTTSQPADPYEH